MIIAKTQLLKEVKKWVKPFVKANVGPGSLDLTLSDEFYLPKDSKEVVLSERLDFKKYFVKRKAKQIVLMPDAFVLGITKEKISLPSDVCGLLNGRSRFARMGLVVHATASFIQPGVSNRQVFEIKNMSGRPLKLKEGLKVAQLTFVRCEGEGKYKGVFSRQ